MNKLFIVLLAIALIPFYLFIHSLSMDTIHPEVQAKLPEIEKKLNKSLKYRPCVSTGPFPYSVRRHLHRCKHCEALVQLGMLEKDVTESDTGRQDIIYSLTPEGRERYVKDGMISRICFGKAKVYKVMAANPPALLLSIRTSQIKYQVMVEDPQPELLDGSLQALDLEAPMPGTPALYSPECVGVNFFSDNSIDFSHIKINRWPCVEIWFGTKR